MRVNYIKEITSFTSFIMEEEPSGNAQLLWYALMAVFNMRGQGDEWPDEIRISNQKLLAFLPYGEDTMVKARQELEALGRITYAAGNRGERPVYGLCLFSVDNSGLSTGREDSPEDNPTDNPKISGQVSGQNPNVNAYAHVNPSSSSVPRFKVIGGDEDDEDTGEIMRAWRETVGPERLPVAAARDLARDARGRGMPGAAADALREAARQGAKAPVQYARALLEDWQAHGRRAGPKAGRGDYLRRNYSPGDFAAMEINLDAEGERWSS